jgi:hypothetical protein
MKTSQRAALKAGEKNYNTGKPCKYGHYAPKRTANGVCAVCARKHGRRDYKKHKSRRLDKERRRQGSIAVLIASLKSQPCADCKISYPPWVMDFDHVRGRKRAKISSLRSRRVITREAQKCQVVCSNCHRNRTHVRLKDRERTDAGLRTRPEVKKTPRRASRSVRR